MRVTYFFNSYRRASRFVDSLNVDEATCRSIPGSSFWNNSTGVVRLDDQGDGCYAVSYSPYPSLSISTLSPGNYYTVTAHFHSAEGGDKLVVTANSSLVDAYRDQVEGEPWHADFINPHKQLVDLVEQHNHPPRMSKNQKAIASLREKDIVAMEENGTVYVCIEDAQLELAQYEIDFQANCFENN